MGRMTRVSVLFALFVAASACSSAAYTSNGTVAPRAPREPERVVIHMSGEPKPNDFVVAGRIRANAGNASQSIEMLRKEAAKNGLDGVADVVCAPGGTPDEGSCEGNGFVYR